MFLNNVTKCFTTENQIKEERQNENMRIILTACITVCHRHKNGQTHHDFEKTDQEAACVYRKQKGITNGALTDTKTQPNPQRSTVTQKKLCWTGLSVIG